MKRTITWNRHIYYNPQVASIEDDVVNEATIALRSLKLDSIHHSALIVQLWAVLRQTIDLLKMA
jgi:hypothetical protein